MTFASKTFEFSELMARLEPRTEAIRRDWSARKPFRYTIIDDFLPVEMAEQILSEYPQPDVSWDHATYAHQKKKFVLNSNFPPMAKRFFEWTATEEFRSFISGITGIANLENDPTFAGGGLHQSIRGGFLDVHIDFNVHPETRKARRLNLLLYLNKDWQERYGGYLELWDMETKRQLENISPDFNRVVIFETNEISYHGHPKPLMTPDGVTRKSLAIYYYTELPLELGSSPEHNTVYRQTSGLQGHWRSLIASLEASSERAQSGGVKALGKTLGEKIVRLVRGTPPPIK